MDISGYEPVWERIWYITIEFSYQISKMQSPDVRNCVSEVVEPKATNSQWLT